MPFVQKVRQPYNQIDGAEAQFLAGKAQTPMQRAVENTAPTGAEAPTFEPNYNYVAPDGSRPYWDAYDANRAPRQGAQDLPPVRRNGSGGGGGYGAASRAAGVRSNIDFLRQMLSSGRFDPAQRSYERDNTLFDRLTQAVSADRQTAGGAYNALDAFLARQASQANAYEGIQRRSGVVGDAFNALLDTLGANQTATREGRAATSQIGRADADRAISAQQLAGTTALDLREAERKRAIDEANFSSTEAARQAQNQIAMQIAELAAAIGDKVNLADLGLK